MFFGIFETIIFVEIFSIDCFGSEEFKTVHNPSLFLTVVRDPGISNDPNFLYDIIASPYLMLLIFIFIICLDLCKTSITFDN